MVASDALLAEAGEVGGEGERGRGFPCEAQQGQEETDQARRGFSTQSRSDVWARGVDRSSPFETERVSVPGESNPNSVSFLTLAKLTTNSNYHIFVALIYLTGSLCI